MKETLEIITENNKQKTQWRDTIINLDINESLQLWLMSKGKSQLRNTRKQE